jgi:nucleotide-binding universal stress UspA family protein
MKPFTSLLLPLDGSHEAAKAAGCALWLSRELGATLHVVYAAPEPLPAGGALAQLHFPEPEGARIVLHQTRAPADIAVLEAVEVHDVNLVVMSTRGESVSSGINLSRRLGKVAQTVIVRSPAPVVLLPRQYREILPWTSMLVADSGEAAANQALETAACLAGALRLRVSVLHAEGAGRVCAMPFGTYADAAHHEYARRMQGMLERGLAACRTEECHAVCDVFLRHGDPADMLLEQIDQQASSVLALGWHGTLDVGRALVFKRLLEEAVCALLLVRRVERPKVRLRVGAEIGG